MATNSTNNAAELEVDTASFTHLSDEPDSGVPELEMPKSLARIRMYRDASIRGFEDGFRGSAIALYRFEESVVLSAYMKWYKIGLTRHDLIFGKTRDPSINKREYAEAFREGWISGFILPTPPSVKNSAFIRGFQLGRRYRNLLLLKSDPATLRSLRILPPKEMRDEFTRGWAEGFAGMKKMSFPLANMETIEYTYYTQGWRTGSRMTSTAMIEK